MVTFRESGSHHSKGIIVAIGRLLSRDVTSVKSPGASNYSHSPDHDKVHTTYYIMIEYDLVAVVGIPTYF